MLEADERERLIIQAIQVQKLAFAPYSKFRVGAALLCSDRSIVTGCNIENSSYGLSICAERVAIGNAISSGKRDWIAMAIVSRGGVTPCGACRQFIIEFTKTLPVILVDESDGRIRQETQINDLLPNSFQL